MECELEDETVQDAEGVRTISNPRQREEHDCAIPKLVHCMFEKTWNRDEAS